MYKLIIYIAITSIISISCQNGNDTVDTNTPINGQPSTEESNNIIIENSQFESSNFELGMVSEQEFLDVIEISGEIHLPQKSKATVSALMEGVVGSVDWLEGQWVSKGTTLFFITNPELISMQEQYLVLKGQVTYLRKEYERKQMLANESITTQNELLKVKSELSTAEARYAALGKKLELYGIKVHNLNTESMISSLPIRSPISGYITEINIIQGGYLSSGHPAIRIANMNHMHIELAVLEKDISKIKKGQEIHFSLTSDPSITYTGYVHLINKVVGENGIISVHGHLDKKKDLNLVPGMHLNAKIILDQKKQLALPNDAIVNMGEELMVLKLLSTANNRYEFEKVRVNVRSQNEMYSSVNELVKDDSRYLTKGAYYLIH